ncbi:hypothetical protein IK110_00680 [Candidatus Saccharibacteria bacterium]|nr:hypothetical protein [Candidatus Saccharibacteria bacterium]
MDPSLVIFLIAILIVGVLVFIAISMTSKRGHAFDKEDYQVDFLRIENSLQKDNESSYAMAIIEGDKILDRALMEMGVQGRTMGDRLKRIGKSKFTQLNAVWHAHKLRNQIAHEHDFKPEYRQAQHALETYKQALKDLGAI